MRSRPEWNGRYGYQALSEYDLKPGGKFRAMANDQMNHTGLPEVIIDGEVVEVKPPHKLVQTYRWLFNDQHKAKASRALTCEDRTHRAGGFCLVTVTHDTTGAPMMSAAHAGQVQRTGRRRMELDPQRSQVTAGDGQEHDCLINDPEHRGFMPHVSGRGRIRERMVVAQRARQAPLAVVFFPDVRELRNLGEPVGLALRIA